jgi:hypothetical protein
MNVELNKLNLRFGSNSCPEKGPEPPLGSTSNALTMALISRVQGRHWHSGLQELIINLQQLPHCDIDDPSSQEKTR